MLKAGLAAKLKPPPGAGGWGVAGAAGFGPPPKVKIPEAAPAGGPNAPAPPNAKPPPSSKRQTQSE